VGVDPVQYILARRGSFVKEVGESGDKIDVM
jgi:hypothetical protein